MDCIGVVDTTFARVDMGSEAIDELRSLAPDVVVKRITVPGIKNTIWGAKKLMKEGCTAILVVGWVGPSLTDKLSYLAMSLGLIELQIQYDVLILDATVHEDEATDEGELKLIAIDRARKHARNLVALLRGDLTEAAGRGLRQGRPDVGPII
ncbi:riboflavin synthase [Thermoproteus tenax]|uniref:Riboflavin synthase n=1 Tax=Thermoproteus tenax (strain ATCC 35583 / DSM 2078 / JCM 9277 / NBRC 100435 / Kra 1) TaxID=768679 RepID=G4RP35_THETK|nr:riboflavin synthase [Thermoproteus tenax]CCC81330.1 riboflavin synthase [Thermoproteus tenax Kra 1]